MILAPKGTESLNEAWQEGKSALSRVCVCVCVCVLDASVIVCVCWAGGDVD